MGLKSDTEIKSRAIQDQLQADKDLSEFTYGLNMQATENERAYNTPQQQLQRLKDAGLNPLYFGLDGNSSNGAPFTMNTPSVDSGSIMQAIAAGNSNIIASVGQVLQASKQMAEVKQMDAQTRLMEKQASNVESQTNLNKYELTWRPIKNGLELRVGESSIKVNESEVRKNTENARVLENEANRNQDIINEIASRIRANVAASAESYATAAAQKTLSGLNVANTEKARAETGYWKQKTQTEEALTGISFEQWAQEQIKTGALPEQLRLDLGLKGKDVKLKDAQIVNLQKLSDVYKEQAGKIHEDLIIDGVKVGIWKNEDGKLVYDYAKVVSQSTARNIEHTLGVYLKMYEDFQNTQSNSLNAVANLVGSAIPGVKLSLGQKNGVTASPPPPPWATENYY